MCSLVPDHGDVGDDDGDDDDPDRDNDDDKDVDDDDGDEDHGARSLPTAMAASNKMIRRVLFLLGSVL